jgi:uncharacterized membrane protein
MDAKEMKALNWFFDVTIWIKLVNAALETIGGLVFLFAKPSTINNVILQLTQHELVQDPRDMFANFMRHQASLLTIHGEQFAAFFLLSHGIIKGGLLIALLQKRLWAYPVAITVFIGFIVYQLYQYVVGGSPWLIALTALDVIVVILTYIEYNNLKNKQEKSNVSK